MIDWSKTAFVFPGQNSQSVGMGKDLAEAYTPARSIFMTADGVLKRSLSHLCFEGPEEDLNLTANTQPAVYVCSMAILSVIQAEIPDAWPAFVAGHSLGEFTALTAAGVIEYEAGLTLVQRRGELMRDAGRQNPGAMAAILGLEADVVREICDQASREAGKPLVLANDNCPGQTVISGDETALDKALTLAEEAGAKRVVKLNVSVAAHSPLMQPASEALNKKISEIPFKEPRLTVIGNVNAAPLNTVGAIHHELNQQLTEAVRWTESIQYMIANGVDTFVEIGPGKVLTGLLKRIDRSVKGYSVYDVESLTAFIETSNE